MTKKGENFLLIRKVGLHDLTLLGYLFCEGLKVQFILGIVIDIILVDHQILKKISYLVSWVIVTLVWIPLYGGIL